MELYNFNAYNNPLLGSIDELETSLCLSLCSFQVNVHSLDHILRGDEFDTLLELSARYIIKHSIAFKHLDIPPRLAWMMTHPRNCALCGVPIVQCFTEYVRFDIVCSYHRVPLLFRVCTRPHKEYVL